MVLQTWMKGVLALAVPLMVLMVLSDTVDGFYGDRGAPQAYVIEVQ